MSDYRKLLQGALLASAAGSIPGAAGGYLTAPDDNKLKGTLLGGAVGAVTGAPIAGGGFVFSPLIGARNVADMMEIASLAGGAGTLGAGALAGRLLNQESDASNNRNEKKSAVYRNGTYSALIKLGFVSSAAEAIGQWARKNPNAYFSMLAGLGGAGMGAVAGGEDNRLQGALLGGGAGLAGGGLLFKGLDLYNK